MRPALLLVAFVVVMAVFLHAPAAEITVGKAVYSDARILDVTSTAIKFRMPGNVVVQKSLAEVTQIETGENDTFDQAEVFLAAGKYDQALAQYAEAAQKPNAALLATLIPLRQARAKQMQKLPKIDLASETPAKDPSQCTYCNGTGKVICTACGVTGVGKCPDCKGKGTILCPDCQGKWKGAICPNCKGAGKVTRTRVRNGRTITNQFDCPDCQGKGKADDCPKCKVGTVPCPACKGTGRSGACPVCGGTKKMDCPTCSKKESGPKPPAGKPADTPPAPAETPPAPPPAPDAPSGGAPAKVSDIPALQSLDKLIDHISKNGNRQEYAGQRVAWLMTLDDVSTAGDKTTVKLSSTKGYVLNIAIPARDRGDVAGLPKRSAVRLTGVLRKYSFSQSLQGGELFKANVANLSVDLDDAKISDPRKPIPEPAAAPAADPPAAGTGPAVTFFRTPVKAQHVVFLLETAVPNEATLKLIQEQAGAAISALEESQSFQVVTFSEGPCTELFKRRLSPANAGAKDEGAKFLAAARAAANTGEKSDPCIALANAYSALYFVDKKDSKAIILLTRGDFEKIGKVLDVIKNEDPERTIPVHVFLLGEANSPAGKNIKKIAEATKGEFRAIAVQVENK